MKSKQSAGILVFNIVNDQLMVLLVHPGGPFYAKKDEGVWSVPKGEYQVGEDPLSTALREFEEETGNKLPDTKYIELEPVKIKSGKVIIAWAVKAYFERAFIKSNLFELEWPPKSGKIQMFPEVDKADWFLIEEAKIKINRGQLPLLQQLEDILR